MVTFGKRALNKAQTRLDILNATFRLTQNVNLRDLNVKTIAAELGITEMTFFNHFARKEDILGYMMGIWGLDLMALQLRQALSGEAAIRRIFAHTADWVKRHPNMMANFIAYLATNDVQDRATPIEAGDRYLLYPDLPELYAMDIPSGNELLIRHLAEMSPQSEPTPTLLHLASCFYGDVLVAHTAGLDIEDLYRRSLDLIFGRRG